WRRHGPLRRRRRAVVLVVAGRSDDAVVFRWRRRRRRRRRHAELREALPHVRAVEDRCGIIQLHEVDRARRVGRAREAPRTDGLEPALDHEPVLVVGAGHLDRPVEDQGKGLHGRVLERAVREDAICQARVVLRLAAPPRPLLHVTIQNRVERRAARRRAPRRGDVARAPDDFRPLRGGVDGLDESVEGPALRRRHQHRLLVLVTRPEHREAARARVDALGVSGAPALVGVVERHAPLAVAALHGRPELRLVVLPAQRRRAVRLRGVAAALALREGRGAGGAAARRRVLPGERARGLERAARGQRVRRVGERRSAVEVVVVAARLHVDGAVVVAAAGVRCGCRRRCRRSHERIDLCLGLWRERQVCELLQEGHGCSYARRAAAARRWRS
ncbi:unnamed protein product, partial [Pelagomonas calceolata]